MSPRQNTTVEQLDYLGNVVLDLDQPLSPRLMHQEVISRLGEDNCCFISIGEKRVLEYTNKDGKKILLLLKAITYLGNPHPAFKKRIQLPDWYQTFCSKYSDMYDIRFLGVYHFDGHIQFVDFEKNSYLTRGLHNSSAHVYINDLYQGQTYGVFKKQDRNNNNIICIRQDKLKSYLDKNVDSNTLNLFELFRQFNNGFTFGEWLRALDAIKEMHDNAWKDWRQTEWAGWFLEYKFNKFTIENHCTSKMRHICQKKEGDLDFDIRFEESDFYGDLKASDVSKKEAPANDQESLIECIYRYNRFWYVIYEHESVKDSVCGYSATKDREIYLRDVDPVYYQKLQDRRAKEPDKIHGQDKKMKNQVRFIKMTIIELNKVNFRDALKVFSQGKQQSGDARKPKFSINKKTLENDNYAVFRYTYQDS